MHVKSIVEVIASFLPVLEIGRQLPNRRLCNTASAILRPKDNVDLLAFAHAPYATPRNHAARLRQLAQPLHANHGARSRSDDLVGMSSQSPKRLVQNSTA